MSSAQGGPRSTESAHASGSIQNALSSLVLALASNAQPKSAPAILPPQLNPTAIADGSNISSIISLLMQQMNASSSPAGSAAGPSSNVSLPSPPSTVVGMQAPNGIPETSSAKFDILAGTLVDDEDKCVTAIKSGREKGLTTRQALERLHGVNNHTAGSWKDYYLEHQVRIDARLLESKAPVSDPKASSNPPAIPNIIRNNIGPTSISIKSSGRPQSRPSTTRNTDTVAPRTIASSSKSSGTSQKQPNTVENRPKTNNQPAIQLRAPLTISSSPSRSPTPPTEVIAADRTNRKNKFTPADEQFFVKSVQWQLKNDPYLSLTSIANVLAEKVPSHSHASWMWLLTAKHRDLVEQMIASACGGEIVERESDSEDNDEGNDDSRSQTEPHTFDPSRASVVTEDVDTDEDAVNVGLTSGPYTHADFRLVAKHIASWGDDWDGLTYKARWTSFHEQHPQRSFKSWGEFYRRRQAEIGLLAQKYRLKKKNRESPSESTADEADSSPNESRAHPSPSQLSKRKHNEDHAGGSKRLKG